MYSKVKNKIIQNYVSNNVFESLNRGGKFFLNNYLIFFYRHIVCLLHIYLFLNYYYCNLLFFSFLHFYFFFAFYILQLNYILVVIFDFRIEILTFRFIVCMKLFNILSIFSFF